jgi:hypothetical protein
MKNSRLIYAVLMVSLFLFLSFLFLFLPSSFLLLHLAFFVPHAVGFMGSFRAPRRSRDCRMPGRAPSSSARARHAAAIRSLPSARKQRRRRNKEEEETKKKIKGRSRRNLMKTKARRIIKRFTIEGRGMAHIDSPSLRSHFLMPGLQDNVFN